MTDKSNKSRGRSPSRSPHRLQTKSQSRSRSRSRSKETSNDDKSRSRNNTDLVRSWRDEMDEKRNKTHSTHNKSPINTSTGSFKVSFRWYYRSSKVCFGSVGYYEELPPIYFDGIGIGIRAFPLYNNNHSGIGLVLVNKQEIMDRIISKCDQPINITVSLGVTNMTFAINLHEFSEKRIVFKELTCGPGLWASKNYVNFEFTFKKNAYMHHYLRDFDTRVTLFELTLKYGDLKIFSVDGKDFDAVQDVVVGRYGDKENNNNNNNKQVTEDSIVGLDLDEYVRCNASIFASLGNGFKNMIFGDFNTSKEIFLNVTLEQIKCIIWYGCTEQLHLYADPALHYALGTYLQNNDLKRKARRACIADLKVKNIMKYVRLYDKYRISKKNGLELLAAWIRKMKEKKQISDILYAQISEFKYVENCV
eukprot:505657_1